MTNWRKIGFWVIVFIVALVAANSAVTTTGHWIALAGPVIVGGILEELRPVKRWLRAGGRVRCRHCAEPVRREATLCPHCRSDLRQTPAAN